MDVHSAKLRAAAKLRKYFSRIQQALRIECTLQTQLLIEVDFIEHRVHEVALLNSDTVFTGQYAADLNAKL